MSPVPPPKKEKSMTTDHVIGKALRDRYEDLTKALRAQAECEDPGRMGEVRLAATMAMHKLHVTVHSAASRLESKGRNR